MTSRMSPFSWFMMETLAAGTAAPVWSVTMPDNVAPAICASARWPKNALNIAMKIQIHRRTCFEFPERAIHHPRNIGRLSFVCHQSEVHLWSPDVGQDVCPPVHCRRLPGCIGFDCLPFNN